MDRREFLNLLASTGALGIAMPACLGGGGTEPSPGPSVLPDHRLPMIGRPRRESLTPYLVIPRFASVYRPDDPLWNEWLGAQWTDFRFAPHGHWFVLPDSYGASTDVVVPVINLGNLSSHHLVVEVYEGPPTSESTLADCRLCSRRGPLVLHPGRMMGVKLQFTRQQNAGSAVAICYDPFFDPIHSITTVGPGSQNRKNVGNCPGIIPPLYGV